MNSSSQLPIKEGHGGPGRALAKDLLKLDSRQDSPVVTEKGNFLPEKLSFSFERYYDRDYARREYEKIFLKTWQLAAREEDIPNTGDRVPFDLGPGSFVIVRSAPDEIKAFFNSCRHRGTILCTKKESGDVIRCPVHGWQWKPDGSIDNIPSWWDFKGFTRTESALREVKVGRWGGFIFINADPDARALEDELGPIPKHFETFEPTNRYTAKRFRKVIRANWKVGQEAFQEAYHVTATHGLHAALAAGDTQSEYLIWKSRSRQIGVGRVITPSGIPSMNLGYETNSLKSANAWVQGLLHWLYPNEQPPRFDLAVDLRQQMAQWHRELQLKRYSRVTNSPDTVMIDVNVYYLFPNTLLHLSEFLPYAYTFTPHPSDPELCVFDLRLLLPCPVGSARPPAAEAIDIGADERMTDAVPEFSFQAKVFQEDIDNMQLVQRGVRAADPTHHFSRLGLYQEAIIRHWHATYDELMDG